MRKSVTKVLILCLAVSLAVAGCARTEKAESGRQAIEIAKTMDTVQQKTDYLVSQAKAFYNSDEFQNVIDVTQYILRYLDKDSPAARELLDKAQTQLTAHMKKTAEALKKSFASK